MLFYRQREDNSHNFSFIDGLALVFIALKLSNHIDWSWIWVLAPLWIYFILLVVIHTIVEMKDGI